MTSKISGLECLSPKSVADLAEKVFFGGASAIAAKSASDLSVIFGGQFAKAIRLHVDVVEDYQGRLISLAKNSVP